MAPRTSHPTFERISLLLLLALFVVWAAAPGAYASPVVNNFEGGSDGAPVTSTDGRVVFATDADASWRYGDVRTGDYDAPYPSGGFAVDGTGFVWMGPDQGAGRVNFVGGARSFTASFSTATELTVTAFAADHTEIGRRSIPANIDMGRLDSVSLTGTPERPLSYVTIIGRPRGWLMDNLAVELVSGPEDAPAAAPPPLPPANLLITQRYTPSVSVRQGDVLTHTLIATNRGQGRAAWLSLRVPFDTETLVLLDASFSRPDLWVSDVARDTLTVRGGALQRGEMITTTLRFHVRDTAALGSAISQRTTVKWPDGNARSNRSAIVVSSTSLDSANALLTLRSHNEQSETVILESNAFVPGEPVSGWYTTADGASTSIGQGQSDSEGVAVLPVSNLPSGPLVLVLHGQWSGISAVHRMLPALGGP